MTAAASEIGERIEPGLLIETSRGCWCGAVSHCTFCGLNGEGMAYRRKSPQRVIDRKSAIFGHTIEPQTSLPCHTKRDQHVDRRRYTSINVTAEAELLAGVADGFVPAFNWCISFKIIEPKV
jgi:hypothetical protein